MRRRWIVVGLLALLVAVPAWLLHWLLYTQSGLDFLVGQLRLIPGVRIEVRGATGTIAGAIEFDHVLVDHDAARVEVDGLRASLVEGALLAGRISLRNASVDGAAVTIKDRGPQPESETHFLPSWMSIVVPDATIRRAVVTLKDGTRLHADQMRGGVRLTRWRIDVDPVTVQDPAGRIDGKVFLRASQPLELRVAAAGRWKLPDGLTYRFNLKSRGHVERLDISGELTEPARVGVSGTLIDRQGQLQAVGTVRVASFDGSPWIPAGRLPPFSGSIAVDARHDGIGIDGTLTSPEFGSEPVRVHGSGRYGDGRLDVLSLKAWLPRSTMALVTAGHVRFAEKAPELDLQGEWTALRWPLTGEPEVESPQGTYTIKGPLPYSFRLSAKARGPKLPSADLSASGSIDRDRLVIDRLQSTVLDGELAGSGRLSWDGRQPWSANIEGRALNLSLARADLKGRIDVAAELSGEGFTASSPWSVRASRISGTLFGRPLVGRGQVSGRDGVFEMEGVRLAHAGSRVDIDGRWGPVIDLRWNADIESLAIVDPSLQGALVSSGSARGDRTRPQIEGRARVHDLRFGALEAGSIDVDADLDLADLHESRVDLRATGLKTERLIFDSAHLLVQGRTSDHHLTFDAVSPGSEGHRLTGFKASLTASGRADLKEPSLHWSLDEATITFPDGGARLAQPTVLDLSPERVRVDPLCLTTGDARLCIEGDWQRRPESWRVLYSAQDWPLRRLLTTLLGRREFDGRLQLSGWAEQQPGQDWIGAAAVVLDEPTIDIRRNRFRSDRVEIGGGRLDIYADAEAMRATLDMQMAASTQLRGHVESRRHPGQPLSELPLTGELHAESSVMTALPLFVPEIDHSEGLLDASVRVGGTLGDPRLDGEFHLRDGRIDLYRTNLSLTEATLDGRFVGDTLEFEGRATSRKGPVWLNGRFSWPDGVMTGSMKLKGENLLVADTPDYRIQASPDLTVTAERGQYTVTGEVLIPTARISPKDLSTSVSTSDDERIIGEQAEETGPSTLKRVHSRIRVVLGDDVRVDAKGLKARLTGDVTVTTEPGEPAHGTGSINVIDGEYKAFGVYVTITKGVLRYQDAPLGQPTLDLVAQREIKDEDIKVSVNVRGRLDHPFITLSSEPAMPSNEALSYLLTGRSINTLQSNEAASVNRAAESLAVSGGGLLLGGLGTRLGLDEVAVESTKSNDTQVVLGKFLSPKLFVSYGISIAEAINTIKLRYTLNGRWSLKAEAGLDQSADIEYRIER